MNVIVSQLYRINMWDIPRLSFQLPSCGESHSYGRISIKLISYLMMKKCRIESG